VPSVGTLRALPVALAAQRRYVGRTEAAPAAPNCAPPRNLHAISAQRFGERAYVHSVSTLNPARFRRLCGAVFAALVGASAILAAVGVPAAAIAAPTPTTRFLIALGLSAGPLSGWALSSTRAGSVASAWPLLLVATLVCCVPLGLALRRRSDVLLVTSAMLWLCTGYLFTIAIWI